MLPLFLFIGCFDTENKEENTEVSAQETAETFDIVAEFSAHLQGHFSSEQQASLNPNYYPVSLKACPIDVPDIGEVALYVEQVWSEDPYRQRIYILEQEEADDTVRSTVYSLTDERAFVGYCDSSENWTLSADDVEIRQGCHVIMEWDGTGFHGGSEAEGCVSTMNGASYATSIVTTTADTIEAWDRGWFSSGEQTGCSWWSCLSSLRIINKNRKIEMLFFFWFAMVCRRWKWKDIWWAGGNHRATQMFHSEELSSFVARSLFSITSLLWKGRRLFLHYQSNDLLAEYRRHLPPEDEGVCAEVVAERSLTRCGLGHGRLSRERAGRLYSVCCRRMCTDDACSAWEASCDGLFDECFGYGGLSGGESQRRMFERTNGDGESRETFIIMRRILSL